MAKSGSASTCRLAVRVVDGQLAPVPGKILFTLLDGNYREVVREYVRDSNPLFTGLPFADNFADNFTVIASASKFRQAGIANVPVHPERPQTVYLMLLPEASTFSFGTAQWADICEKRPKFATLLRAEADSEADAARRYADLEDRKSGAILACLLNVLTALDQLHLPQGTALDYLKSLIWSFSEAGSKKPKAKTPDAMEQDRFFCWVGEDLPKQLEEAARQGVVKLAPHGMHPGATLSYKQVEFGEANVQATFHEGATRKVDGKRWIKAEFDIDYYQAPLSHLLLEVAVNQFGGITDPKSVFALRWIAGQKAGRPEFDPLYRILPDQV